MLKANSGSTKEIIEMTLDNGAKYYKLVNGSLLDESIYLKLGKEFVDHTNYLGSSINYTEIVDNMAVMRVTSNGTTTPLWAELGDPSKSGWRHIAEYIRPLTEDPRGFTRLQQLADKGFLNKMNISNKELLESEFKNLFIIGLKNNSVLATVNNGLLDFSIPLTNNGITVYAKFGGNGFFQTVKF